MKTRTKLTEEQKQWAWFAGLWLGGFMSLFLVATLIKTILPAG